MPLTSETRLGPYELTELLGSGGTGDVYKAIDTRLNRTVAVKLLKGPDTARLVREAQLIAALNDAHICAVYDIGPDYLVMEYVEGIPIKGPLPLIESLNLATQIAAALEAAHSQGIIHRDLKPRNILVNHGIVKLLDFGHAKLLSSSPADDPVTLPGSILGTAAYMSPEQAQGKSADFRSDIFAFGIVLYEMFSGRQPFTGDTVLDVLNSIVNSEPRTLDTSLDLNGIVMRCLRKDPADRFQSMGEVTGALAQIRIKESKSEEQPSIAVLPFSNLSDDPENEYFCEGLTEEIINKLSQIPALRVTARTSAFAFRKQGEDIRKIAEILGVHTILEGSVRKSGTRLRVTPQLIKAADGYHVWSTTYDRERSEVFAIQDDISEAIARALQVRVYHGPTSSIPAYEAFLKARYHLWKMTPESFARSRECYEQAIALDPEFALAYSGYAGYYLLRGLLGMDAADEAMPAARTNARKALEIDRFISEAHVVLATVAIVYDYDLHEAQRQFELAMGRETVPPSARMFHAFYYLLPRGKPEEAVREVQQGLRDDPLNPTLHFVLGVSLLEIGSDDAAFREFHESLELDQNYVQSMAALAMAYFSRGLTSDALTWAERRHSLRPEDPLSIGLYAGLLVVSGDETLARKVIEKLGNGQSFGSPFGLTIFNILIGNIDEVAHWLEMMMQQHFGAGVFYILHGPLGKGLLSSPSWPELVKNLKIPETILSISGPGL
jgi:serine/threonine protein kinase/tetratricopeptide (TPR) repeat protein